MTCATCGSSEGPFDRFSVVIGSPKTAETYAVCGFRAKVHPSSDERKKRSVDCNARRAKLDADGVLV